MKKPAEKASETPTSQATETAWTADVAPVAVDYGNQDEAQRRTEAAVAELRASWRVPVAPIPSTDTPQLRMPTVTGSVTVVGSEGAVVWPVQPEALPIEAPDEPQVFIDVPPDAVYLTAGARLLAEGWRSPLPEIERLLHQRETLLVAVKRITERAVEDPALISTAVRAGDVDAAEAAMLANARHTWSIAEGLHGNESRLVEFSMKLELELEKLLWHNQRAVLRSLIGRNSAAVQVLRRRVERMQGTPGPRSVVLFTEYALFRRELP